MLQFIFGRPASGKTYTVLNSIKRDVDDDKAVVLIVPEQFSFESERAVLRTVGDNAALSVSVMSFNRLFDEVGRVAGGISGKVLSDSDKIILMNRALVTVSPELKLWSRYARSVSFAQTMLDTIGEFKINAVTPDEIIGVGEGVKSAALQNKLHDIALIYKTFDTLTGEKFIDPADRLTKLYYKLEGCRFFENKTVYIDSFKGFTGQQYKIIRRILSQAENVFVSMTNDTENSREYDIFTNIRSAAARIEKAARSSNVKILPPIILGESRYTKKSLAAVERLLATGRTEETESDGAVNICLADTAFDEAEFAARTVRKLVREQGYRYRDFVIIARDADTYEEAVTAACAKNRVSCFSDKRQPLSAFPAAAAADAAIEAVQSYSTEAILRFHKTGLGTLSFDEIPELENYTFIWNINGAFWNGDWTMDVRGLVSGDDERKEQNVERLEYINTLRKRAMEPLLHFSENFRGSAADMAAAIVKLFDECEVAKKLAAMCGRFSSDERELSSAVLKQSYDMYADVLDSLVRCFGNATIGRKDFTDALRLAVSLATVGTVPQTLDEVTFGSADRIRPSRPKVAIILGTNQGVFPAGISTGGILAIAERRVLIEQGIDIPDNSVQSAIDESFLVYTNVCCPSEKLYICRHAYGITGESAEPSAFVNEIVSNIPCTLLEEKTAVDTSNAPETPEAAYSAFCKCFVRYPDCAETVRTGVSGETSEKIDETLKKLEKKDISLSKETALKLYGRDIKASASKLEVFNKCHFSFFCKYGLSAKKLQPADFDVLQRGTLVHYVLEKLITKYKKSISDMSREQLDEEVKKYSDEYIDGIKGFRNIMTARDAFLIDNMVRTIKEVAWQLSREFLQSDFAPCACEFKIGADGDMPALKIPYDGGNVLIEGSIDRVDKYNGYIRVIDYKTGTKSFRLPDVLFGLNLQMLIYLYAVVRGNGDNDENAAGIFYMPAKRDLSDKGMAMNGLMQNDIPLVMAMEKNLEGEFIPKPSLSKDNKITAKSTSFIPPEGFTTIFEYIEKNIKIAASEITGGNIAISPVDGESDACKYCDYSAVCGIENGEHSCVPSRMSNKTVLEEMGAEEDDI